MKRSWFKGVDEKQYNEVRAIFINALPFRKRLTKILEERVEVLQASMRNESNFDSPNWPYIQADRVAQTKAFLDVIDLIKKDSN